MAQSKAKSDPIYGSLGIENEGRPKATNDEMRLEEDLRLRKPVKFELEKEVHPETATSLENAQHNYKHVVPDPNIEKVT